MWLGRWSKELSLLYDYYYEQQGIEPDCDEKIDYDDICYNDFVKAIKASVISGSSFSNELKKLRHMRGY